MMEGLRDKIIRRIIEVKKTDPAQIAKLDQESVTFNDFKNNLIKSGIASEEDILFMLSREYDLPYLDVDRYMVPKENKKILERELAFRYKVLPISEMGRVVTLATADPLDVVALDDIRIAGKFIKIDLVLAKEVKIMKALQTLYSEISAGLFSEQDETQVDITIQEKDGEREDLAALVKESKLPPIVRVVDLIVYEGLKRRASDIHIEPSEDNLDIRYRIDGVLQHGFSLPKRNQTAVLARFKIMSSLNITEFRVPQDGRFKVKFEGREIDFRVSSLPANFGEKIVLRILDKESLSVGLKPLGFSDRPLQLFMDALASPFGIILVTGPTGSGKSTTLYAIITQMNDATKNIVTIEDPVEYQVEGITQVQVKPEIGLNFVSCLRSVLRQSPDIIMVGEIRDSETADVAIKASLTGELIFSTLHTNTSVGAITRLSDMGVEPFLIASSLVATTAQRLVRKLCERCKVKETIDQQLARRLGIGIEAEEFFKPKGCSHCNNTGYRGRMALLEILSVDDTIREMIVKRALEEDIISYARRERGFAPLKEDGLKKCREGITSLEEVLRVAG